MDGVRVTLSVISSVNFESNFVFVLLILCTDNDICTLFSCYG